MEMSRDNDQKRKVSPYMEMSRDIVQKRKEILYIERSRDNDQEGKNFVFWTCNVTLTKRRRTSFFGDVT